MTFGIPIDRRRPPEGEPTIGNLIQSGSLRVGELLELHRPANWLVYVLQYSPDIDGTYSSNPLAFSQKRPSHDGNAVALNSVCSKIVSTPPRAWMTSVRYALRFHSLPSCL